MNDETRITCWMERPLHDAIRALARAQDRSVGAEVRRVLRTHVAANGIHLPPNVAATDPARERDRLAA